MPSDFPPFKITIRAATKRECTSKWANVSWQESAALVVGGKLVALYDEYGTAYTNPDLNIPDVWKDAIANSDEWKEAWQTATPLELLAKLATDIYTELLR